MTDTGRPVGTKLCPHCGEEIDAAASVCTCGEEFTTVRHGYCSTCHSRVLVAEGTTCETCGSEVRDIISESHPEPFRSRSEEATHQEEATHHEVEPDPPTSPVRSRVPEKPPVVTTVEPDREAIRPAPRGERHVLRWILVGLLVVFLVLFVVVVLVT